MSEIKNWMFENKAKWNSAKEMMDAVETEYQVNDDDYLLLWDYAGSIYAK